ncbi:MAG: CPBP family intramembrane metalloprotease [Lachnospiraceae bacterium]|nr:CPBP family intramembrane metalloprotease [Lachnospiraceae bacterium]
MSLYRKNFSAVGLIYAGMLVLVTAIQYGISILFSNFAPNIISNYFWLYFAIAMAPTYVVGYPMVKYFMDKREKKEIEKRKLKFSDFFVFLCISECFLIVGSLIGNYVNELISAATGIEISNPVGDILSNSVLWVNIIVAGIIGPIFEELLFRKLLIDNLAKYGEGLAITVSGFAFGLFHGNFTQFFYATMIGLLFGYIYVRTGRIRYTIILHMMINLGSTLITPVYNMLDMDFIDSSESYAEIGRKILSMPPEELWSFAWPILILAVYVIGTYGMGIAGLILYLVKRKRMFINPVENEIYQGYRFRAVMGSLGIWVYILACAAMFAMAIFLK